MATVSLRERLEALLLINLAEAVEIANTAIDTGNDSEWMEATAFLAENNLCPVDDEDDLFEILPDDQLTHLLRRWKAGIEQPPFCPTKRKLRV